jgi:hypothetical protein
MNNQNNNSGQNRPQQTSGKSGQRNNQKKTGGNNQRNNRVLLQNHDLKLPIKHAARRVVKLYVPRKELWTMRLEWSVSI